MNLDNNKHLHTMPKQEWEAVQRHMEQNTISLAERGRLDVMLKHWKEMDKRFDELTKVEELLAEDYPEDELVQLFNWDEWASRMESRAYLSPTPINMFDKYVRTDDPKLLEIYNSYGRGLEELRVLKDKYEKYYRHWQEQDHASRVSWHNQREQDDKELKLKSDHLKRRYMYKSVLTILLAVVAVFFFSSCGQEEDSKPTYQVGETFGPNNQYRWHIGTGTHQPSCHCDEEKTPNVWHWTETNDCLQYSNKPQ